MDLQGRVVLVTGAGRGLGRSIVLEAAQAGATVVGGSRTAADLDSLAAEVSVRGGRFAGTRLDVTDLASVDAFVAGAAERFGRIDGLVNNTGAGVSADSLSITEEQFAHTFDFNARSTFFCSQRAARHMVAQGGGAIVNISSNFAVAGVGVRSVYCAAKAAVDSFTRSFAVEWAPLGVRVNAVAPGEIETAMIGPEYEALIPRIPMGRMGTVAEVAGVVFQLCGSDFSYVTGTEIFLTGGQHLF